jgi:hypothetical protein
MWRVQKISVSNNHFKPIYKTVNCNFVLAYFCKRGKLIINMLK